MLRNRRFLQSKVEKIASLLRPAANPENEHIFSALRHVKTR